MFGKLTRADVIDRLAAATTAYGSVNSVHDLIEHPQLRTTHMPVGSRMVDMPAPQLDEHGKAIRDEFAPRSD